MIINVKFVDYDEFTHARTPTLPLIGKAVYSTLRFKI